MTDLYIDIVAQSIYQQILRTARRYSLEVYVVTKDYLAAEENIHLIAVQDDQVDGGSWIVANIARGDICVTADAHLADNCILRGALALSPTGLQWGADAAAEDAKRKHFALPKPLDAGAFAQRLDMVIVAARAIRSRITHRTGFAESPSPTMPLEMRS